MNPAVLMRGGRVQIKDRHVLIGQDYVIQFGVSVGWDAVRFFPQSDMVITADGIGRASFDNSKSLFESPWDYDIMGFWIALPNLPSMDFEIEYQWLDQGGGFGRNKHGLGWWPTQDGGGDLFPSFLGTWDQGSFGYAAISGVTNPGRVQIQPCVNTVGQFIWRKLTKKGSDWSVKDGLTRPADGSLGSATYQSPSPTFPYFGLKMAGTHRIKEFSGILR